MARVLRVLLAALIGALTADGQGLEQLTQSADGLSTLQDGAMPNAFAGTTNLQALMNVNATSCTIASAGQNWMQMASARAECLGSLSVGAGAPAGSGWAFAGTPVKPGCNGTGYLYVLSSGCGDVTWSSPASRYPPWGLLGPRVGPQLAFAYGNLGYIFMGGYNFSMATATVGDALSDVWVSGTNGITYDVWYRAQDLPDECFLTLPANSTLGQTAGLAYAPAGATLRAPASGSRRVAAYAFYVVFNQQYATSTGYLYCSGGAAPTLYTITTDWAWTRVGASSSLAAAFPGVEARAGDGAFTFAQIVANVVEPEGRAAPAASAPPAAAAVPQGERGQRSPAAATAAAAIPPQVVYGCLVAAGGGTGNVSTSVNGVSWITTPVSVPAFGTRRSRLGIVANIGADNALLVGGRGDGAECVHSGRPDGAGGDWCGDVWAAPAALCCVTGYDAGQGYTLCGGHGTCTPSNRYGFCTCDEGWVGTYCDAYAPSASAIPTPSASAQPSGADGSHAGLGPALATSALVAWALAARHAGA